MTVPSAMLLLRLLGKPTVRSGEQPVTGFISVKAQALLFYLVCTRRSQAREALAALFWGEMSEVQASKNLRNVLSNLRGLVGAHLCITRTDVEFDSTQPYWLDLQEFLDALGTDPSQKDLVSLHHAVELYQGDFLEGFFAGDALGFEEWMLGQRASLHGVMVQALHTLVVKHLARHEYAAGIEYANRLLALEPWREETHRHLMLLYAHGRQRSAALAQYETCRRVLKQELGAEPIPETTALYERILAATAPPPHNLPSQNTRLVGRVAERAQLIGYLEDAQTQLITLVGPGGIGKTRLALYTAAQYADPEFNLEARFRDGIFFIPLAEAESEGDAASVPLLSIIADALRVERKGALAPQAPLLQHLRDKDMLLVLDDLSQRIPEAKQLSDILRLAPRVKLLVTSRVRLNLQQEYLIEMGGLEYPFLSGVGLAALLEYSAVQLFVQHAQRVQPGFELNEPNARAVARICQLVEGVPLGIELAATWVRLLSPQETASEMEKGFDVLTSALQNVSERHRSLRAVFDYSWNLLSPAEQSMFEQLAVFRGGFERGAAAQVVGASLPILAGLADKSLVRRSATGRYEIHRVLWQYAQEKLQADAAEFERVHDAHCRYYADLLWEHQAQIKGEDSSNVLTALDVERENVRAAWNWAVSQRRSRELNLLMECL